MRWGARLKPLPNAWPRALLVLALAGAAACRGSGSAGDEIVICGVRHSIGTPVVLWKDPGGYDAYDTSVREGSAPASADRASGRRYTPGRATPGADGAPLVPPEGRDPQALARAVDLFVLHYDACGTSSRCFEVLQHRRGLSVHFLLDLDGTLYQTLDLRETAWHAAQANARSIGVEIAHIGAYTPRERSTLDAWYSRDDEGPYVALSPELAATLRTEGFVARPARPELLEGELHGVPLVQYDFTDAQYEALSKLLLVLCRELPRIRPDAPRDASGRVRTDALSDEELAAFSGILGHSHVTARKVDPGPAFDWERLLHSLEQPSARR